MTSPVINVPEDTPITPDDIDTKRDFMSSFDHMETEVSAWWIVKLCQELGGWFPFTLQQIQAFYTAPGRRPVGEPFHFNRLVEPGISYSIRTGHSLKGGGWIVLGADNMYRVTLEFVDRCYLSSPNTKRTPPGKP